MKLEESMLPESKMDRFVFLGAIPVVAAVMGSVVGALMQAQACSVVGASEIQSLLLNAQLTGIQKIEFMKQYMEVTDRPWGLARSVVSFLTISGTMVVGVFATNGGFRR